ncbi:homocysteine S-methyltransferase family protein [[Clostridium] fimetarium]|uniref:Methionine synthase n=1 Tax=[Clostridium] fimetarium TaxID=99656 RepID=A0A1I0RJG4_9FIRM|nr:homocysteine S-methyltransferase family protein [[Clostridium] fimetarium]SEW41158.1 5-methyltetrahydrofolate--homocysteine methyltransferase [[Clostridium] fimetarium]
MFRELLKNEYVIFDGAMGTMLQAAGMKMGETPEVLSITQPELLIDIHTQYINAGAQVIYANTFGANSYKLEDSGYCVDEIVKASIANAKKACKNVENITGKKALVALDIGPIGQMLEPTGTLSFEEAYEIFKEIVVAGRDADLIVFETMTDLLEAKAGVLAAKENSELPVVCTMTFEMNMRTFTGCSVSSMALTLSGLGVDALGVNCSLGPKELVPVVAELSKWTKLPIVVKANAGLPDPVTNSYNVSAYQFAEYMKELLPYGIKVLGGCCGTNPEYISEVVKMLTLIQNTGMNNVKQADIVHLAKIPAAVCSATNTVTISEPRIIGERINPTGKKLFKEALLRNDIDYILNQALDQIQAGADILDVNVGLPGIDEKEVMVRTIKSLQAVVDVPLQIDSTIPEVLEAALRVYNGKPIVNSVNGEEESLNNVLPLVKKYGAAVVGLTLDKNGIPPKAEERLAIAKKILDRAVSIGIPKEDVYIDCLTLTASAEQAAVMETLKAVNMVKTQLGLKTVLGVSNISFGLPNRELINHIFLTMALTNGLDLAIINPNIEAMTGAIRAYKLLANIDENSMGFIRAYSDMSRVPKMQPLSIRAGKAEIRNDNIGNDVKNHEEIREYGDLFYAVENGLKNEGAQITEELLKTKDSMEIVNGILIPALDKIGMQFENGTIFLPQLIMSAGVAQAAFEVIRKKIIKNDLAPISKGKIVIATVKGDIHDIGKNIVKVLLQNYGYDVIDLGKDVEYQAVVDAVIEHNAKLVGLSALMTTTLVSMEKTIALIHSHNLDCKIMVGGAVLTSEYAKTIGADYYAKDAKESVDIAKKILG